MLLFTEFNKLFLHISQKDTQPIPIACAKLSSGFKICVDVFLLIFSSTFSVTRSMISSYWVNWSCKRAGRSSETCREQLPLNQTNEITLDAVLWEGHPGDRDNQKSSWKTFVKDLLGNSHSVESRKWEEKCAEGFPELKDLEEKKKWETSYAITAKVYGI